MSYENRISSDDKKSATLQAKQAATANAQPEVNKELSDDQIASVAGGAHTGPLNPSYKTDHCK